MTNIRTKSFTLSVYSNGDKHAGRLALVLPGRLDTKDYPHMHSHVDLFARHGFFALSFDPPGTWGSEGNIELYTMTNYLKAINELIEHFGNKPTLLMGHSRGGSMAMLGAITNPYVTHFIAAMSRAGASARHSSMKLGDVLTEYRDVPGHPDERKKFDLPYSFFEDSETYDMREGLKTCRASKLFIAGTRDRIVDPNKVKEAYEVAAEPKLLEVVNFGHDYRHHPDQIEEVNRLVEKFFKKNP
jgi:pimeloyl-ACP methyl ester carboxylesterase